MASAKAKMLRQASFAYLLRKKAGAATGTVGAAGYVAGAASITLTTGPIAGLGVAEPVVVGEGEESEGMLVHGATAPTGTTVTLHANKLGLRNHASGERVVEYELFDLGNTMEDGVEVSTSSDTTDLISAMQRLVLDTLTGYARHGASLKLPAMVPYTLCVALGIPWANVVETGVTPNKWQQLITDGNDWASETEQWLMVQSILMDGTVLREELWGCDVDMAGITIQLGRGQASPLPCKFVAAGGGEASSNANPYPTPTVTYRMGKGKIVDYVTEVGVITPTGSVTNVASGGTVGASAFTLAGAGIAAIAAADWMIFQEAAASPERSEIHQLDTYTPGTGVGTLKSKFFRATLNYAAAFKALLTPFAGVSKDGVTLTMNGNSIPLGVLSSRLDTGIRPGTVTTEATLNLTNFELSALAQALGIATSAIVNARLPILGTTVASVNAAPHVYLKLLHRDATLSWFILAGCSSLVTDVRRAYNNQGQAQYQIKVRPSSCIEMFNII